MEIKLSEFNVLVLIAEKASKVYAKSFFHCQPSVTFKVNQTGERISGTDLLHAGFSSLQGEFYPDTQATGLVWRKKEFIKE